MGAQVYVANLIERLQDAGERVVLRYRGGGVSGAELLAEIYRSAHALDVLGVARGDVVAMYAPNRPDALALRYATHLIGAGSVFLSAPPDPVKRAQMLVDFDPRLVVVWPETAELLPRTSAPVAAMGKLADAVDGAFEGSHTRLDQLIAAQPATAVACRARPEDLAVIISSGGTTGVPKGSTRDFAAWSRMVTKPSPPDRRQLANGKLAYLTQALVDITLLGGGTVVLQDGFDPQATLSAIEAERITDLFLVEPQLFELMDHPAVAGTDLSSLRSLTHVGAAAAPVLRRRARERLGPVIAHTYGASEMGMVSALGPGGHDPDDPETFGCAGAVLPGVEIRFRGEGGVIHPNRGSIEVRSPDQAAGYLHRPIAQAAFVDGWYRPGDLGHLDRAGRLVIDGRAADCVMIDGALVTPVGLQEILCQLRTVRYAVAVPDPDMTTPIAAVVGWPGQSVDRDACRSAVRSAFGARVARGLHLVEVDRIPLTEQGKPNRPGIRQLAAAEAHSGTEIRSSDRAD